MKGIYVFCFALLFVFSLGCQTANTWSIISSSSNIYGNTISFSKPLQWNDELNVISFIHLKSPTYTLTVPSSSETLAGSVVAMISTDCGYTWDSTAIYSNAAYFGRYPQGGVCNPDFSPCKEDFKNAYIVGCGPTSGSGTIGVNGNWYASKKLGVSNYNNIPGPGNEQQVFPKTGPFTSAMTKHDFSAYNFCATDDGLVRTLAVLTNESLSKPSDTAVVLVTGKMNMNGTVDWRDTVFNSMSTVRTNGSYNFISKPIMAWNETGSVGYLVIFGSRKGATLSNKGFQPIVYKTVNSGGSWTIDPNGIDFNGSSFSSIKSKLYGTAIDTSLKVPCFNEKEGIDCTVDANDKLHIFTTIKGHKSIHIDSLNAEQEFGAERYTWQYIPGFRPYLYDFTFDGVNWTYMLIDSMETQSIGQFTNSPGYLDNPWDADGNNFNQKVKVEARLQLSRTPDGKYIVYSWTETDTILVTNYAKWNIYPNVMARIYDVVAANLHSTELNVSYMQGVPNYIRNHCMFYFASPKCRFIASNANGILVRMPIIVSNSAPYSQATKNRHCFSNAVLNFGNISATSASNCPAPSLCTSIEGDYFPDQINCKLFPIPAKGSVTLELELQRSADLAIEILNAFGQVVGTLKKYGMNGINSHNLDLSGLASGIYMVNVKVDNASSTKKLVVE